MKSQHSAFVNVEAAVLGVYSLFPRAAIYINERESFLIAAVGPDSGFDQRSALALI